MNFFFFFAFLFFTVACGKVESSKSIQEIEALNSEITEDSIQETNPDYQTPSHRADEESSNNIQLPESSYNSPEGYETIDSQLSDRNDSAPPSQSRPPVISDEGEGGPSHCPNDDYIADSEVPLGFRKKTKVDKDGCEYDVVVPNFCKRSKNGYFSRGEVTPSHTLVPPSCEKGTHVILDVVVDKIFTVAGSSNAWTRRSIVPRGSANWGLFPKNDFVVEEVYPKPSNTCLTFGRYCRTSDWVEYFSNTHALAENFQEGKEYKYRCPKPRVNEVMQPWWTFSWRDQEGSSTRVKIPDARFLCVHMIPPSLPHRY